MVRSSFLIVCKFNWGILSYGLQENQLTPVASYGYEADIKEPEDKWENLEFCKQRRLGVHQLYSREQCFL